MGQPIGGVLWGGGVVPAGTGISVSDLIYNALRIIQVLGAPDRGPSSGMVSDGLRALNSLRDAWNTERLTIFSVRRETFPLVASQGSYTIGPGGNFDTTRPVKIEYAGVIQNDAELPVEVLRHVSQWAAVAMKSLTSTIPQSLWYDPTVPLGTIHLYPVPTEVNTLALYTWEQAANISDASLSIALPPGYQRALEYGLAVELAPRFPQAKLTTVAIQAAIEAKAAIKRANLTVPLLKCDPALRVQGARFSAITGDWE